MTRIPPDELARLYREHAPALRLFARQWRDGGEDLVQEAFVRLSQQSELADCVKAWLYQVVRNAAIASARADARRTVRERRAGVQQFWYSETDDRADADEATKRLAELPLDQREIVVARIWGDLTFEEIAGLVGCSLATAHRRYQTALKALYERLDGTCKNTIAPQKT